MPNKTPTDRPVCPITCRLPVSVATAIEAAAADRGETRSEFIRELVVEALTGAGYLPQGAR